eukprot:scaffold66118_cov20-Tisochrysis_lutea.AAC.1
MGTHTPLTYLRSAARTFFPIAHRGLIVRNQWCKRTWRPAWPLLPRHSPDSIAMEDKCKRNGAHPIVSDSRT